MVAHTATSRDPSWRAEPSPLVPLLPPPSLADKILDDLSNPHFSLAVVAQMHGLSLAGILAWLNLPETREQLALRESAAYAHTRHVAALNMEHAVQTAASIVRDYNTSRPEREAQDRKTPGSAHRASVHARKAAWLLYRFSRITPVNEADLRRATGCLTTSANHRVVQDNDANSSRVACLHEVQACSEDHSTPQAPDAQQPESQQADAAQANPVQTNAEPHDSAFESQPLIVRKRTRESAPAPGLTPGATSLDNNISELDQIDDPAFADPPEGGSTHAAAALAATGPPCPG